MIRLANINDITEILAIYERARDYMRERGNPTDCWPALAEIWLGQNVVVESER